MVFAYLGPAEKQPLLPRYDIFEDLGAGERVVANGDSIGSGGPPLMHCNWFQTHENVMDPYHVFILHGTFSGTQFTEMMNIFPDISWDFTDYGVALVPGSQRCPTAAMHHRVTELVMPNIRVVADPRVYVVRQDRQRCVDAADRRHDHADLHGVSHGGRTPTPPGCRRSRTLRCTAASRGTSSTTKATSASPATTKRKSAKAESRLHSEEQLAGSDRGVGCSARSYKRAIKAVADGTRPPVRRPHRRRRARAAAGGELPRATEHDC